MNSVQALQHAIRVPSPLLERAWHIAQSLGEPMIMLLSAGRLGEIAFFSGKLRAATQWLDVVRHLVTSGYTVGVPLWCRVAVRVTYEQNDLAQAEQIALRGIELVQHTSRFHNAPPLYIILARAREALQSADDAAIDGLLAQGYALAQQHGRTREILEIEAIQMRRWLARGDFARVHHWGESHPLHNDVLLTFDTYWLVVSHVYLKHAGISTYTSGLETVLARAIDETSKTGRINDHIHLLILQALLWWDSGRWSEAVASLSASLRLGAPEGYVRTFLDEGLALLPLLAHATCEQAAPALVARLCAILAPDVPPTRTGTDVIEPLSGRELEILRLVATGLSVQQLAEHLVISAHTARTHLRNVYTKLDAHSRLQAIAHARQRGLL